MIPQAREPDPAHLQGADVPVGESHPQPVELTAEKAKIKRGVVRDEDALPDEFVEERDDLLRRRLADQHFVRDAVNPLRTPREEDPRVDQRGELRDDITVPDVHGADLDQPVAAGGGKPRRFDVDDHVAVKQTHDLSPIWMSIRRARNKEGRYENIFFHVSTSPRISIWN
jgi:hypothetical protein